MTSIGYDDVGRISTRQNTAGLTTYSYGQERQNFFNVGRLTTVTFVAPNKPDSILLYDYDALGRVLRQSSTVDGQTYTASKEWAPGGYLQSIGYQDGDTVGPIGYDEAGRVMSVSGIVNTVSLRRQRATAPEDERELDHHDVDVLADPRRAREDLDVEGAVRRSRTSGTRSTTRASSAWSRARPGEGWQYDYDELNHMGTGHQHLQPRRQPDLRLRRGRPDQVQLPGGGTYDYPTNPSDPRPHAPSQ